MFWRNVFLTMLIALMALSFLPSLRKARRRPVRFDRDRPYRVYTREFDVEINANDLDAFLAALPDPDHGYSERFTEAAPQQLYDLETELAARAERTAPIPPQTDADDAIVSLLIDHSGSMRGRPMLFAARAALVASDLLESLGAKLEVLGFTTTRWKGGQSREKWLRDGQPPYPGRLNDLLHIVYCSAGETLGTQHCAAMLRKDLVKENIDGEAIAWAASRLRQRKERWKYLIVLSDGAPVDDSTLIENGDGYLSHHLRSVTSEIEEAGDIQLAAIGIGHPVERYYKQGVTIRSPDELEQTIVQLIGRLLSQSS
ncbi:cobalamin biosynthesis protein CobT [Bradyrhizobium ontarionense]|uniref:Cobalamin biosynthesis protein CobT n=1 Tax=Bradyrhizobium ontarionense TaxID=2898149 RepID=A0ABY3R360_9BRAD|nr:cobalamin biosynthesis protein CobT [Bradyrhizobium sp. A19]UFZ01734.1 cobalamin biosynthesis protein CobT [Bradyrhizobium sp. A19]